MWTQGATSLYERIELDLTICLNVVNNITLFYKSFVLRWLLGCRDIFKCPKYSKVIFNLEEDEISDFKKEDSTCCDSCSTWWHLPCADLTMHPADELDCWVCESWLADAANFRDTDDDLEFNSAQDPLADTLVEVNHVCPICSLKSVPCNWEHISVYSSGVSIYKLTRILNNTVVAASYTRHSRHERCHQRFGK